MKNLDKNELKRLWEVNAAVLGVAVAAAALALSLTVANKVLEWLGFWFRIPYCACHDFLHLYCPVCGATRAGVSLLKLDFIGSLKANPLLIIAIVGLLIYDILSLWRISKGRGIIVIKHGGFKLGIFLALFAVARNILMIFFNFDTLGELSTFWQFMLGEIL